MQHPNLGSNMYGHFEKSNSFATTTDSMRDRPPATPNVLNIDITSRLRNSNQPGQNFGAHPQYAPPSQTRLALDRSKSSAKNPTQISKSPAPQFKIFDPKSESIGQQVPMAMSRQSYGESMHNHTRSFEVSKGDAIQASNLVLSNQTRQNTGYFTPSYNEKQPRRSQQIGGDFNGQIRGPFANNIPSSNDMGFKSITPGASPNDFQVAANLQPTRSFGLARSPQRSGQTLNVYDPPAYYANNNPPQDPPSAPNQPKGPNVHLSGLISRKKIDTALSEMKSRFLDLRWISKVSSKECSNVQLLLQKYRSPPNNTLLTAYNAQMSVHVPFALNEQIIKDIKRTYSSTKYFNKGTEDEGFKRLYRLLIALSGYKRMGDCKIGYVQGMNFIAASFLWHCNEESAFFLIVKMFDKLRMEEIYGDNLQMVEEKAQYFMTQVLESRSTDIFDNIRQKEITPVMILAEWIITLGFSVVPMEKHINLMIGLLDKGWDYLYSVLLRYFRKLFTVFKDRDFAETMQIIKNNGEAKVQEEFGFKLDWDSLTKN